MLTSKVLQKDTELTLQIRDEETILKEYTFFLLTKHPNTWCNCTHLNEPHRTFSNTGK